MSEPIRERLDELRDETNADTLSEVMRRALAVYDALWSRKKDGRIVILRDPETGDEQELLLL